MTDITVVRKLRSVVSYITPYITILFVNVLINKGDN